MKKNFLFILFPTLMMAQAHATSNQGFTYGDVYNNGQRDVRNQQTFQKDSTAISRNERSDGSQTQQRETFLTNVTRDNANLIKSNATQNKDFYANQWQLRNKQSVHNKGEEELRRTNYRNDIKSTDEKFGQRYTGNSRVIVAYKSDRNGTEVDRNSARQDSTYIRKDSDMDWVSSRIIDCSTVRMEIYQNFSCPAGATVADNINSDSLLSGNGYYYYHRNIGQTVPYENTQYHFWDLPRAFQETVLNNGVYVDGRTQDTSWDKYRRGVSQYKVSYWGKGKITALTNAECFKRINVNDPNTYSNIESSYIHDNCATACTNDRSDHGTEHRRETIACSTFDRVEPTRNIFIKYKTTGPETITADNPSGSKVIAYTKNYLFQKAKGNVVERRTGKVIPSCEAYGETAQVIYDCVRDQEHENILRIKYELEKQKTTPGTGCSGNNCGGSVGTGTGGGGPSTPPNTSGENVKKAEDVGSKTGTDAQDAGRADGISGEVILNGQKVNKIVYPRYGNKVIRVEPNGTKVYEVLYQYVLDSTNSGSREVKVEYDGEQGAYVVVEE